MYAGGNRGGSFRTLMPIIWPVTSMPLRLPQRESCISTAWAITCGCVNCPYGTPTELGSVQLTTLPAGHCLGSAMLLADDGTTRLLYTGDFKLGESLTAQEAELPAADILVIESTFGSPRYRLPPREESIEQLVEGVQQTLDSGRTPVVHAYAFGQGAGSHRYPSLERVSRCYSTQASPKSAGYTSAAVCRSATGRSTNMECLMAMWW